MPARHVHLVRHGLPLIDYEQPASAWPLDPVGTDAVRELRRSGRLPERATWFCSPEPKALETARLLTDDRVEVVDGLREQVRLQVGWIEDIDVVRRAAYASPDRPAYEGWEPLAATRRRAGDAVHELLRTHPKGDLVLVGHGTCLSLVAAELTGTAANPNAPSAMGFPDVVTIRMRSAAGPAPLAPRAVVAVAAALTVGELASWLGTGRLGWVLAPAALVSAAAVAPRRTRDLGVSLLAAVLIAVFLMSGLVLGVPRLQT